MTFPFRININVLQRLDHRHEAGLSDIGGPHTLGPRTYIPLTC